MSYASIIHRLCTPVKPQAAKIKPKLTALSGIKAVVFDVYGTLFLTQTLAEGPESAIRKTLEESDFTMNAAAQETAFATLFNDHLHAHQDIRRSQGVAIPEVDICEVWTDFLEELEAFEIISGAVTPASVKRTALEYECHVNPVWPTPALDEVLQMLKENNFALGIVSNAQFYTPILFETLLSKPFGELGFEEAYTILSYNLGEAKPSTHLFKLCADNLKKEKDINPEEILYVGNDIKKDIIPAQSMKMKTALYTGHAPALNLREDDPECAGVKSDLIINSLEQLSECLIH
tara:strand:- start:14736 stop:15608 length:873 start_codon:yes stop_codon:yes gene_type:complete